MLAPPLYTSKGDPLLSDIQKIDTEEVRVGDATVEAHHKTKPDTKQAIVFCKAQVRITGTRATNMGPMQGQIGEKTVEQVRVFPMNTTLGEIAEYLEERKTHTGTLVIENGIHLPKDERVEPGILG